MNRISKIVGTLAFVALASPIGIATAQGTDSSSRAAQFRANEATLQQESTNMPSSSAPVDRTAAPADAIPKAKYTQQKRDRFAAEEHALQTESTNMAPSSSPVNKATPAADPIPQATTKTQKKARFAAEEKAMQQESTP
jgi:hypothetical protein